MIKRLLVVLFLATAFVLNGGATFAQNVERAKAELAAEAEQLWPNSAMVHANMAPLPALPVPPIMTDGGMVKATNPRPLNNFPVARHQPAVNPQQATKPIPAIKAPPVVTEKGKVETPNPRPTQDFPVAKPQQDKPAIEMSRQEKREQWPWQVKNETKINIVVNPPAFESGEDKKIATKIRPGELLLMERKYGIWNAQTKKTNEIPQGYTLREGKESGS